MYLLFASGKLSNPLKLLGRGGRPAILDIMTISENKIINTWISKVLNLPKECIKNVRKKHLEIKIQHLRKIQQNIFIEIFLFLNAITDNI